MTQQPTIINLKTLKPATLNLLDLARALADYMGEDGLDTRHVERLTYADRLQIQLTLHQMVMARKAELS